MRLGSTTRGFSFGAIQKWFLVRYSLPVALYGPVSDTCCPAIIVACLGAFRQLYVKTSHPKPHRTYKDHPTKQSYRPCLTNVRPPGRCLTLASKQPESAHPADPGHAWAELPALASPCNSLLSNPGLQSLSGSISERRVHALGAEVEVDDIESGIGQRRPALPHVYWPLR